MLAVQISSLCIRRKASTELRSVGPMRAY